MFGKGGLLDEIKKELEREMLNQKQKEVQKVQKRQEVIQSMKQSLELNNSKSKERNHSSKYGSLAQQRNLKVELLKKHAEKLGAKNQKSIIQENNETFEERYGTRDKFVDTLYSYSDSEPTEIIRTVQSVESKVDTKKNKSKNRYFKKLKSKSSAREAFINSVIFTRKNIGAK